MYQHTKRDIHIFSEPRNQLKVTQRDAYFSSSLSTSLFYFPLLLKTLNFTDAMILVGPLRKTPPKHHHSSERGKSKIGPYPQQPEAVILLPEPVILDEHPLASADDGVEFY